MSRKIRAAAASAPAPSLATPPPQAPPLFASLPQEAPAWGVSMLVHFIVLLALALIVQAPPRLAEQPLAIVAEGREAAETEAAFEVASPDTEPVLEAPAGEIELTEMVPLEPVEVDGVAADPEAAPLAVELSDLSAESAISSDLLETVGALGGEAGGLGGRINPQRRDQLVASGGGNPQSEAAVEAALKWFVQHQLPDGGWSLDLARRRARRAVEPRHGTGAAALPRPGLHAQGGPLQAADRRRPRFSRRHDAQWAGAGVWRGGVDVLPGSGCDRALRGLCDVAGQTPAGTCATGPQLHHGGAGSGGAGSGAQDSSGRRWFPSTPAEATLVVLVTMLPTGPGVGACDDPEQPPIPTTTAMAAASPPSLSRSSTTRR